MNKKKILVVASHPDDEIIGCGGTLLKYRKNKYDIKIVFTFLGNDLRKSSKSMLKVENDRRINDSIKVTRRLGISKPIFLNHLIINNNDRNFKSELNKNILKLIKTHEPEIIFTHSYKDIHKDHRDTFEAVHIATRPQNKLKYLKKILMFEIPSATENYFLNKRFSPNHWVNIDREIKSKISLLKIYKKEMLEYPNSRSLKAIENLCKFRGNQISIRYAEAFEVLRSID